MKINKKLIEVALPLEAINKASAREKSIRHGHPSTLHLWWARRPLAAARAVIFAQMVDDPSAHPDLFATEKAQEKERKRLFKIIEDLVQWENTTNEVVLERARAEIWNSWRRACAENADHPRAKELFNRYKLPAFHDPFAGGGSLPLEAQRLGLEAYASDLNPVAVLINKAMIEIPPKFAGKPPVNPESQRQAKQMGKIWQSAQGLAEDVRYYGQWIRDEAEKRIGHLYPKVEITAEMAKERPDLKPYVGKKLTVIAWIWARTVKSPNPAFANVDVPLASTFVLSSKPGKEAHVDVSCEGSSYRFRVKAGQSKEAERTKNGTKSGGSHTTFRCLMSGTPMTFEYLRTEAKRGRMGARLMAVVAEAPGRRIYLSPTPALEAHASVAKPASVPDVEITHWPGRTNVVEYGLSHFADLFTPRQLVTLATFSELVEDARQRVLQDAMSASMSDDPRPLRIDGSGAKAYADAVVIYLAIALDKMTDYSSSLVLWSPSRDQAKTTFTRQALPMTWDFAEVNAFAGAAGDLAVSLDGICRAVAQFSTNTAGHAVASDAQTQVYSVDKIVSTDPPYYDNIGYSELSDFFYVWLRRPLRAVFPDLFATVAVPKAEELVASAYRHGNKDQAESFFVNGMTQAMHRVSEQALNAFPVTIYYAFKQAESDEADNGVTASTGWDTFLEAVMRAGFEISGTWPVRTERGARSLSIGMNALASSIVLVCRRRGEGADVATRREFVAALKSELPVSLVHLQKGNIAPVDLQQAAIGPGMAVYTRYSKVVDAEGKVVSVREALTLINQTLDEVLAEQEGDFDADTRFAISWFDQSSFATGEFGVADVLARAKNTSVDGMKHAGILDPKSPGGKVRLLKPSELPADWDPADDQRLTAWEVVHQLIRALEKSGEGAASDLVKKLGSKAETARELAYRLYTICERKKRAQEALSYNGLVQSWPEIVRLAGMDKPESKEDQTRFATGGDSWR